MPVVYLSPVARRYLIAAALCVVVAAIGTLIRHYQTKGMREHIEQAHILEGEATVAHSRILGQYEEGDLTVGQLAEGLERETLPRWQQCVSHIALCRTEGAKGELLEDLDRYFQLRLAATHAIVEAVKKEDESLLATAQSRWFEANQLAEWLEIRRITAKPAWFYAPELSLR